MLKMMRVYLRETSEIEKAGNNRRFLTKVEDFRLCSCGFSSFYFRISGFATFGPGLQVLAPLKSPLHSNENVKIFAKDSLSLQ